MGTPADTARDFNEAQRTRLALEALAARTEERAVSVRRHALQARSEAACDRARGDREAERLHLGEAETHERSARAIEQTAARYRERIRRMADASGG